MDQLLRDESGSYLIREFEIKVKGLLASRGVERIGWDPLQQQARSWLFDKDGGFSEGTTPASSLNGGSGVSLRDRTSPHVEGDYSNQIALAAAG